MPALTDPAALRARLAALVARDPRPAAQVAAAAGLKRQYLADLLAGRIVSPSAEMVGRILGALGKDWSALDANPNDDSGSKSK